MFIEKRDVEVTAERTISSDESGLDRIQLKSLEYVSNHCNLSLFIKHIDDYGFHSYKGGLISEGPILNEISQISVFLKMYERRN